MADWPYNTAQWKRLRLLKLGSDPLCQPCAAAGLSTIANTVDHNRAVSAGGAPFPALDQLTSMCTSCHSQKTARGIEAGAVRASGPLRPRLIVRKGCDANGNPLDSAHPWNEKSLGAEPKVDRRGMDFQLVSMLRSRARKLR